MNSVVSPVYGGRLRTLENEVASERLGLTEMFGLSGSTPIKDAGDANADILQAWTDGGWRSNRLGEIDIAGRRIPLSKTWTTSRLSGIRFRTAGLGGYFSENQYGSASGTTYNVGGLASGFVWADKADLTGAMVEYEGYGWDWGDFVFAGNYHETDPSALYADSANRKEIGMLIHGRDTDGMLPTGKSIGNFTFAGLETGVKTIATPFEDNADQLLWGRVRAHYCDTLFHSTNKQTLGNVFSYVDQLATTTGYLYERGGTHTTLFHCLQAGCDTGLKITGNDTNIIGAFNFPYFKLDGTSPNTALAIDINPTSGYCAPVINMFLDVDNAIAGRTSNPAIRIHNCYGRLNLSGMNFYPGMIKVTGGLSTYPLTVCVTMSRYRLGNDMNTIRNLFTADSSGSYNVLFRDNNEAFGDTGEIIDGKFYNDYRNKISINSSNSTVTVL